MTESNVQHDQSPVLESGVGWARSTRRFELHRDRDASGVSGTGVVADGVEWPDGSVSIRWRGERPSVVFWATVADAEAVHGHGGLTRFVWLDTDGPAHGADPAIVQRVAAELEKLPDALVDLETSVRADARQHADNVALYGIADRLKALIDGINAGFDAELDGGRAAALRQIATEAADLAGDIATGRVQDEMGTPAPAAPPTGFTDAELGTVVELATAATARLAGQVNSGPDRYAEGYAAAVSVLRDDERYRDWSLRNGHPDKPVRRHLADYLKTVGPDGADVSAPQAWLGLRRAQDELQRLADGLTAMDVDLKDSPVTGALDALSMAMARANHLADLVEVAQATTLRDDGPYQDWDDLRSSGLLWLINRQVFHPRGFALALEQVDGRIVGWSLLGNGSEVWRFGESEDEHFAAAQETLRPVPGTPAPSDVELVATTIGGALGTDEFATAEDIARQVLDALVAAGRLGTSAQAHEITVTTGPALMGRPGLHYPTCSCGWRSPVRYEVRENAVRHGETHQSECATEGADQ